jgi:hypothetical protein
LRSLWSHILLKRVKPKLRGAVSPLLIAYPTSVEALATSKSEETANAIVYVTIITICHCQAG